MRAGDTVIAVTASGRTPYPVTGARIAGAKGARVVAIANNAGAAIFDHADVAICLPTPPELGAGSTRMGPRAQGMVARIAGVTSPAAATGGGKAPIADHTDIAIGLNAASAHAEEAKQFLEWVGSAEFATLYANALPGFFSLNSAPVAMEDPLAQDFVSWRDRCHSTIRSTYQILSRGTPNLENETGMPASP